MSRPKADEIFRVHTDDEQQRLAGVAHVGRTGDEATLYHVWVPPDLRGSGYGAAVLRDVCAWADREQVKLVLMIDPSEDSPLSFEGLFDWYMRHDFRPGDEGLLHREPTPDDQLETECECPDEGHPVLFLLAIILLPWLAVITLVSATYYLIIPMVWELLKDIFG